MHLYWCYMIVLKIIFYIIEQHYNMFAWICSTNHISIFPHEKRSTSPVLELLQIVDAPQQEDE